MTTAIPRLRRMHICRPLKLLVLAFLAFSWGLGFLSVRSEAAGPSAVPEKDACLDDLPPAPKPIPPAVRVVELVNCSDQSLLGAANAAHTAGQPPTPVYPREGTWVMGPVGSPDHANVLTIDIPPQWADTSPLGSSSPNIWARTGCRYDVVADKAQCETGGSGGVYDVSKANGGPPGATTITEWNFYQKMTTTTGGTYYRDNFDISAVNGVSLTVDIQAVGGDAQDPGAPENIFWLTQPPNLSQNSPMAVYGDDLRADDRCPATFRLKRSELTYTGTYGQIYGYVVIGVDGKPEGGDGTVACFSNCGKYKFPLEPLASCDISDPTCYNWKTFCAGDPSLYGTMCTNDADCPVHGSCWDNHDPGSEQYHRCALRAFNHYNNCDPNTCTFPYGFKNPYTGIQDFSTQPPFGLCKDVDANNTDSFCIGDDTVHTVFPHAYTWPNDPQTYADDAPLYRVIFAPGGTTVPITPAEDSIPLCSSPRLAAYGYENAKNLCSIDIGNGAEFAIARPSPYPWSCNLGNGAGNDGVICRWK
ncbi:MAG: hypothetical protein JO270_27570 [Acidobacteriaceae bacterium]|nr:hypothetical protein [Acidobacteriaceae bacterium]